MSTTEPPTDTPADGAHFVIFKDTAGEYRWRLVAGNHEIVASSEGYTSAYDAERGAAALVRAALGARGIATESGFSIKATFED